MRRVCLYGAVMSGQMSEARRVCLYGAVMSGQMSEVRGVCLYGAVMSGQCHAPLVELCCPLRPAGVALRSCAPGAASRLLLNLRRREVTSLSCVISVESILTAAQGCHSYFGVSLL